MYQTVGHQAIELYADAMDLPLYRRTIQGSSLDTSRNYRETEGDEVEDLYQLLHLVKVGICARRVYYPGCAFSIHILRPRGLNTLGARDILFLRTKILFHFLDLSVECNFQRH